MKKHNFKELLIWQQAMDIVDDIYAITREFPKEELFGLSLQMRKSAISIPSNISEGCGRGTAPQLAHFLDVAQGSAYELETQCYISLRQHYSRPNQMNTVIQKLIEDQKMIEGFRNRFA